MGVQEDICTCTDTCTPSDQGVSPHKGWLRHMHTGSHIGSYLWAQLCESDEANLGSQVDTCTCTDVFAIFNEGVEPEFGWPGHPHVVMLVDTCLHATMPRSRANLGTKVDRCKCSEAVTPSDQGMGPHQGWLGHIYRPSHVCTCQHTAMQREWGRQGVSGRCAYIVLGQKNL